MNRIVTHYYFKASVFAAAIIFMLAFSAPKLTTAPRLWVDEAKNIELAESYHTSGVLDMELAPDAFTGVPHLLQSTGYPVTVPLALWFKLFGFGLEQARAYMLIWMVAAVGALFVFLRKLFDERAALFAVLLVVTFASFYDNGRAMMGEIPGFFFLVCGLYFWLCRDSLAEVGRRHAEAGFDLAEAGRRHAEAGFDLAKAGILFGLAVVAKPSVYLLIIPALALALLFRRGRWKNIGVVALAMLPAAILWVLLVMPHPFDPAAWQQIIDLYTNPYNGAPIAEQVAKNLAGMLHTPTLIYFGAFFLCLLAVRRLLRGGASAVTRFYDFTLLYSLFAFIYYLRSPGWLRYIIVAELLILSVLPHTLHVLFLMGKKKLSTYNILWEHDYSIPVLVFLVAFQVFHLFTGAKIYASDRDIKTAEYLADNFAGQHVAFLDALNVAIFKPRAERLLTLDGTVVPVLSARNTFLNVEPLSSEVLPEGVVVKTGRVIDGNAAATLAEKYVMSENVGGYMVYRRK